MNDFQRGVSVALAIAMSAEEELAKSMAHFATVEEWKGYKRGVQAYRDKLQELRDA